MASPFLGLTTAQIAVIATSQLSSLATSDYLALTTDQMRAFTTDQFASLQTKFIAALTTTAVAALRTDQVVALTTEQVAGLKASQVAALTTANIAAMETADVAALTTANVVVVTTAGIAALTTDQVVALRTDQVVALRTNQVAALTTEGTAALETRDVVVLTTAQVQKGLTTNQIVALTTDQITALTTTQVEALQANTSQWAALTTDQFPHLTLGTPIVLDLNGNGISTQNIASGVQFDIFGTGQKVNTGWAAGGDGLLVLDRNHDGSINGGTELFGEGTNLANGQKAANGYAALAELDANADGAINSSDGSFADLMVWVDGDADGVSQATELHSLNSLGITQLGLNAQTSTATDNGNLIGLVSNYTTADGAVHDMADVWFQTSTAAAPAAHVATVPAQAVSLQLPPANIAVDSVPAVGAVSDPMRSQVGSMVDAMAAFGNTGAASAGAASGDTLAANQKVTMHAVAAPAVTGMVDAMKQFDANGQPVLAGASATMGQVATTLTTTIPRKPDTDILASS